MPEYQPRIGFDGHDSDPRWQRIGCLFCLLVTALAVLVVGLVVHALT